METILKAGKFTLIGVVWLFIALAYTESVDIMTLIQFSFGLFYAIIAVTVGFAIFNFAENPKSGIKFISSTVLLTITLIIGYYASSVSYDPETGEVIEGSQFTEGGIYALYFVTIVAIVLIFLSEIKRMLKL